MVHSFLKYLKGRELSSRPVYIYFCLTQAWLSWERTAASAMVCITWALQLLSEMVQTELRVIWRNTENIVKLVTRREVMSVKVNLSVDEIPWDKRNLSVPFQHWKLQDGCWEQPGRWGNLPSSLFWAYATNWTPQIPPPCSTWFAVCDQHQLLSRSGVRGFFFRDTSSDCSLRRAGSRSLFWEFSEVDLEKVCLHNSPSLYSELSSTSWQ